jgi:lysophospholipase L1-like esterase
MGTSISMGWVGDGTHSGYQDDAWPAQLANAAGKTLSTPFIEFPGCKSPIAVPLILFKRESGERVDSATICAPNQSGITLPSRNVALAGARVKNALFGTPENTPGAPWYARVLPPNTTQVGAMAMQHPRFVSVEFGANEVLQAVGGLVAIPQVVEDPKKFAALYDELLARIKKQGQPKGALLVGLTNEVSTLAALRTGAEIWSERTAFRTYNVEVARNCNGSPNLLTIPRYVVPRIGAGLTWKPGLPPVVLSCRDVPGTVDYILTPADIGILKTVLAAMNQHIRQRAQQNGWAYFELESLYGRAGVKPPFSVDLLMNSLTPYGPYFASDGIHPSAVGQTVLAQAAAQALNARYGFSLSPTVTLATASR